MPINAIHMLVEKKEVLIIQLLVFKKLVKSLWGKNE